MPDQKTVSPEEVTRLLSLEEGHFLDLKRVEIVPGKLSESISAFANTAGGELFVGIGEETDRLSRFWNGFVTIEAANGLFQVIDRMSPLSNHYDATFLSSLGQPGHVLHLVVQKTRDIVRASDGHPYVRRNAQNLRVVGEDAMRRLQLDKGIVTFEDEVVNVPLVTITNSETVLGFILEVVPNVEPEEWLKKQHLIVDERPVVVGTLLFSDEGLSPWFRCHQISYPRDARPCAGHPRLVARALAVSAWMAGSSPAMTTTC
jgi:ATP-dependent DNA helicase RecG